MPPMTDIVERLRVPCACGLGLRDEAADEIERLQAALDRLTTQRRQDIGQLRAENERLQAALSKAIDELSYTDLRASGGIAEAP
jgi:hypothetical protein